jgi:hypothetical protein
MVGVLGDPVEIRVDGVAEHGKRDEGSRPIRKRPTIPALILTFMVHGKPLFP